MPNRFLLGLSVFVCAYGCAATRSTVDDAIETPVVDHDWSEADEQAVEELESAWASTAYPEDIAYADSQERGSLLQVYVFDIGQADAMLVIGPGTEPKTLLMDLGHPSGGVRPRRAQNADYVYRRIVALTGKTYVDYFVLSHYHADHAGRGESKQQGWGTGIIKLLSDRSFEFSVREFIHIGNRGARYMKPSTKRGVYNTIMKRMPLWKRHGRVGKSVSPSFGTGQIDLGPGITVEILSFAGVVPSGQSAFDSAIAAGIDYSSTPGNENDLSIALEISAGEFEMFTAGDLNGTDDPQRRPLYVSRRWGEIYTNIEHHMVDYWKSVNRESDVEIYRANHHRSGYSSTAKLLEALDPEFVLYSTGAQYDHPSDSTVIRSGKTARQLATTAVKNPSLFRNNQGEVVGEIEIRVARDGRTYTINGERRSAWDDDSEANGLDD